MKKDVLGEICTLLYKESMKTDGTVPQKNRVVTQMAPLWAFFAPVLVTALALDQVSKLWAQGLAGGPRVDFGFNLAHNEGIVFGFDLPLWGIYVLTGGILLLGLYTVAENKLWQKRNHLFPLALIVAGALGNLIDRVRFGYVVDFIQVYWWPTFNLADVFIVVGVILLSWEVLMKEETLEKL
jgi:signal peptidase II